MPEGKKLTGSKNILPAPAGSIVWNPADLSASLSSVLTFVEGEAEKTIQWYWKYKSWKSKLSRFIQFSAVVLTAASGIVPIVVQLRKASGHPSTLDSGLWASLFIGLAAALFGLDKAFGFSSGWARYVLAATSIQKALGEFRLDWTLLYSDLSQPPKPEQVAALIQRAKDFVSTIEGVVLQETKDWITEFQTNMAQLEKDVKTQADSLKAQSEKKAQQREAASKLGAIELTVSNADKADNFTFQVVLENQTGKVADERVTAAKTWVHIGTPAGLCKLTVTATDKGKAVGKSNAVEVKPGETAKPSIALDIA